MGGCGAGECFESVIDLEYDVLIIFNFKLRKWQFEVLVRELHDLGRKSKFNLHIIPQPLTLRPNPLDHALHLLLFLDHLLLN